MDTGVRPVGPRAHRAVVLFLAALSWASKTPIQAQEVDTATLGGTVVVRTEHFESLQNEGGEDPRRAISIYLPEGYASSGERYPVVYFLPGFTNSHDDIMGAIAPLIDAAIAADRIEPLIVAVPDHLTTFGGSYFSDSSVNGDWLRFTVEDVVSLLDTDFRTLPTRDSRGLAGWSSGAYGAVKIGMLHPDVFSSVYSMSPGLLAMTDEFGPEGDGFRQAPSIQSRDRLVSDPDLLLANLVVAMGRAFSPNRGHPPFYADLPYDYTTGELIVDEGALERWRRHVPIRMLDRYAANMRSLEAFKLEWGRNDEFQNVVTGARRFSRKLQDLGIDHEAEEYLGTHFDRIFTPDGRIATDMLPFFQRHLNRRP